MSEASSSAAVDRDDLDSALRTISELNTRMLAKTGPKYEPKFVVQKIQEIFAGASLSTAKVYENPVLDWHLGFHGLGIKDGAWNLFVERGITTVRELLAYTETELLDMFNVGPSKIIKINTALAVHGLELEKALPPKTPADGWCRNISYPWLGPDYVRMEWQLQQSARDVAVECRKNYGMPHDLFRVYCTALPDHLSIGDITAMTSREIHQRFLNAFDIEAEEPLQEATRTAVERVRAVITGANLPWPAYNL